MWLNCNKTAMPTKEMRHRVEKKLARCEGDLSAGREWTKLDISALVNVDCVSNESRTRVGRDIALQGWGETLYYNYFTADIRNIGNTKDV